MAAYTVGATENGAWEKTLAANVADTVTFGRDIYALQILNEGSTGLYVRLGGVAPTVGGAASWYVPPGSVLVMPSGEGSNTIVGLISSGTPKYSVSEAV